MKIASEIVNEMNKCGGTGAMEIRKLLTPAELGSHCNLFAQATIAVGASLGVHQHVGNAETYYIVSGKGMYTDDDTQYEVGPGETTYCADGHFHGLANIGDEPLVFMALILKSE